MPLSRMALAALAGVALPAALVGFGSLALAAASPAAEAAPPFVDKFANRNPQWRVSDGWSNGPYMVNDWRATHARFSNGALDLVLSPNRTDKAAFSSGEVQSSQTYGYGYFETKMRAAPGSGLVTGFFTYIGPPANKSWDEIDVEVLGGKPREVMFTYFTSGKKVSEIVQLPYDATKETHVYGFDWQPDAIRWYIDGKMMHEARGKDIPLPSQRQKIIVSLWASGTLTDWVGPFDARALPSKATFGCVSYAPTYAARQNCA